MKSIENNNIPKIKIGIIQSTDKVTFNSDHDFNIFDLSDQLLFTGVAAEQYEIKINISHPATVSYQIRAAVFKNRKQAEEKLNSLIRQGLNAKLRAVGLKIPFKDRIIDNRDYWITIGNFASTKEADEFRYKNKPFHNTIIVEQTINKASGEIYLGTKKLTDRF